MFKEIRGESKTKGSLLFFSSTKSIQEQIHEVLPFSDLIPKLLHTFVTSVHELPDATCAECFQLRAKP
jgi:hypothetical protein